MSKNIILGRGQRLLAISLSVVLSLLVVLAAASGATTISSNVNTGGTLTVGSTSSFTGLTTHTAGALLIASSTAVSNFAVNGSFNASSTMYVAGATRFDSGVGLGVANTIAKTLVWSSLASDPSGAEGMVYYNSDSKLLKLYDGTAWANVATSSMSSGLVASGDRVQLSSLAEGHMTIGTTTNYLQSSMLTLQGTSTASIPLTVYSRTGQTTNLFQLMTNVDQEGFVVDPLGMASTTGLSITTGGGLWVGGNATTSVDTGNIATAGTLSVTNTSAFTGKTTHTAGAILVASSTAVSNLTVAGELHASSTLSVTGAATFNDSLTTATSTATTTLAMQADSNTAGNSGEGSCLQLRGVDGKTYRMYVGIQDATTLSTTTVRGANVVAFAVWEAGACQ